MNARILIVGLAPGLKGANRTSRPFTGDYAGDLLYATLAKSGWTSGKFVAWRDDGVWSPDTLTLKDVRIPNAVRCLPPQNKPEPSEIHACRQFLLSELGSLSKVKVLFALGKIAHDSTLKALDARIAAYPFKHGGIYEIGKYKLVSSYHCSRYNTNTGVLTQKMFEDAVAKAKKAAEI